MELIAYKKAEELNDNSIPVISPEWRLKRIGERTILWFYEVEESRYLNIPPLLASILPLFDGKRSFADVKKIIQYTYGVNTDDANKMLAEVITGINSDNKCVVEMNETLEDYIVDYNVEEFIVSPEGFTPKGRLPIPLSIGILFSNDCQTNCLYCYAERRKVPAREHMSIKRWKEIFHEARNLGIEQVTISGGDPLFHKNSIDLLEELIKLKMLFLVSTKCHVTKEKAARLKAIGMADPINQITREIQFSLDGPNSLIADTMAGVPGFYEKAIDSIKNLKENGLKFRVKAVVTPFNADYIEDWLYQMVDLGADKLACAAYGRSFYRHKDEYFLGPEETNMLRDVFDRFEEKHPEVDLILTSFDAPTLTEEGEAKPKVKRDDKKAFEDRITKKKESWESRSHCSGGTSSMTITPDGRVILCDQVPQEGEFVVGDLSEQSIMEVWNSEEIKRFTDPPVEKFVDTVCYSCGDFDSCHKEYGYCFRDSYFNYGTIYAPPPNCPLAPDDGFRIN